MEHHKWRRRQHLSSLIYNNYLQIGGPWIYIRYTKQRQDLVTKKIEHPNMHQTDIQTLHGTTSTYGQCCKKLMKQKVQADNCSQKYVKKTILEKERKENDNAFVTLSVIVCFISFFFYPSSHSIKRCEMSAIIKLHSIGSFASKGRDSKDFALDCFLKWT